MNSQLKYNIRCEWGMYGIESLLEDTDIIIIVDVLSFSTCVDIACGRGAKVYPFQRNDNRAAKFANQMDALLAKNRSTSEPSLSPHSLLDISTGTNIVLPSPNGSTLSLATKGVQTVCGCLRNSRSVAEYSMSHGKRISVIPAGERWPDGSIRFAIEDLLGAGAILSHFKDSLSPESEVAVDAYHSNADRLANTILKCSSGIELIERGFQEDVHLAADVGISASVPILKEGAYINLL